MALTIAIIPARSGSKGVPDKNIRKLSGHCLLEWSIKACIKSQLIDKVYVSTDSEDYKNIAINLGAMVPFLRPKEISTDTSTDYEFVAHALDWFSENNDNPQIIAHIRPTTPFRDPLLMDEAIEVFKKNNNATSLRSIHPMAESAYKSLEITKDGRLKELGLINADLDSVNNPRQSFPPTYIANGYIDLLSADFIRDNKSIHGNYCIPFITPVTQEIDIEEDFDFLDYQLYKDPNLYNRIFN